MTRPAPLPTKALTPDEIRHRLQGADAKALAAEIGHQHTTVWRFLTGKTKRPAWALVQALQDYLGAGDES